jgi:predicted ArsR family transcriptional regulator
MAGTRWDAVAALVDPVRRGLYEYIRHQDHPVTREEAADAITISRTLTAFHLDKLVDVGLLGARYEAPADKHRGRGRTPKVYEPTPDGLTLDVPPRQYELVGEILAEAVATQPDNAGAAAEAYAFEHGRDIGASCTARPGSERTVDDDVAVTYAALTDLGFEPRTGPTVTLGNCPFHGLAQRQPELICGLNHAFIRGLLSGLATETLDAELVPLTGGCCVRIDVAGRAGA